MSRIDRAQPPTGPRKKPVREGEAPAAAAKAGQAPDAIAISVDARVRLGKDDRPELVLEGVQVDGVGARAQAEVERNMRGRRPGLREQVTRQVTEQIVRAIAEQVAQALAPALERELGAALAAERLPAALADDLARELVPQVAAVVAAEIAKQVKVEYRLGR